MKNFLSQVKANKVYISFLIGFMATSFIAYLTLNRDLAVQLASEDGIFEYATAAFFLNTAILLVKAFTLKRSFLFLPLSLIFFVGFGEEISWGQRIFGIDTPESIAAKNMQGEMNLHNLDVFHPQDESGQSKSGLAKLLTIDFLYNLFWFGWCVLLPSVALMHIKPLDNLFQNLRVPVPALSIGVIFILNFGVYIIIRSNLPVDKSSLFYMKLREVFECISALIFVVIGWALLKEERLKTV
jgi:hypothetical protein